MWHPRVSPRSPAPPGCGHGGGGRAREPPAPAGLGAGRCAGDPAPAAALARAQGSVETGAPALKPVPGWAGVAVTPKPGTGCQELQKETSTIPVQAPAILTHWDEAQHNPSTSTSMSSSWAEVQNECRTSTSIFPTWNKAPKGAQHPSKLGRTPKGAQHISVEAPASPQAGMSPKRSPAPFYCKQRVHRTGGQHPGVPPPAPPPYLGEQRATHLQQPDALLRLCQLPLGRAQRAIQPALLRREAQ